MITRPNQSRIDKGMWWDRAYGLVDGCTPCSPGCEHCWSATETHMRRNHPCVAIRARKERLTTDAGKFNGKVRVNHNFIQKPLREMKPQVWSIWNDLFHPHVTMGYRVEVLAAMANCQDHLFLCLTKRPNEMFEFFEHSLLQDHFENDSHEIELAYGTAALSLPLDNLYLGVTVCNQQEADEKIPILLQTPAAKRFVSYEPALEWVDFNVDIGNGVGELALESGLLDLVICGAESGPNRRHMDVELARSAAEQCKEAGVSFFMKQMQIDGKIERDMSKFPDELQRREFPGE